MAKKTGTAPKAEKSVEQMNNAELFAYVTENTGVIQEHEAAIAAIRTKMEAARTRLAKLLGFSVGTAAAPKGRKSAGGKASTSYGEADVARVKDRVFDAVPASGKGKNSGDIAEIVSAETGLVGAALKALFAERKIKRSKHEGARKGRNGDYVRP